MYYKEKYICTKSFIFGLHSFIFCNRSLMSHYTVKNKGYKNSELGRALPHAVFVH